jgi:fatty acid amide hydrolase
MTVESTETAGAVGMSAAEIARAISAGEFSAREAVEAHIRRVEAVNPRLNAVVVPLFERARADAEAADAARREGRRLGPLHGVPVTVKESFEVEGTAATLGVASRAGRAANADGFLVARLRGAGAIILGKTNVSQMLLGNESANPLYGRTNNPWDPERAPGGSSGGEGAIIAAGGSPLGFGSDIGGSVRLPAHACGVHALKPTSGRLTMKGHAELYPGQEAVLAQPGPLARSVADLSLAFDVLSAEGQDIVDPAVPHVARRDPSEVSLENLRVAFYTDNGFMRAAPALRRATLEAAEALRLRGARVEEWTPPGVAEAVRIYFGLLLADGMAGTRRALGGSARSRNLSMALLVGMFPRGLVSALWPRLLPLAGQRRLGEMMRSMGRLSADGYWRLVRERTLYRERFVEALDAGGFDAVVCPPDALPALTHGGGWYLADALSYAALYNLLGMPAGVVAATRVRRGEESDRPDSRDFVERAARKVEAGSEGLPVGVQVAARHRREDVVLAVMAALEEHFRARADYPRLKIER